MYKQKIVLLLVFFVCTAIKTFSQAAATPSSGCAPLQVNFTAPLGATSATWNFGNGSSNLLNPSNVFNTAGLYNVTYTVIGGSPATGNIQITVATNTVVPSIVFTLPASHCAPMLVNFIGQGGSAGSTFQWTFGDLGFGNGNTIGYAYTLGGTYNATLVVTDPAGCSGTTSAGPINVSDLPIPNITAIPGLISCVAPFTTAFSGSLSLSQSPLGNALTYNWNFGNSQTSTQMTPGNITYVNQGVYNVTLTVTDNNNCSNSDVEIVSVIQPTLLATGPGTVCISGQQVYPAITFTATSQSSQPFTTWNMGDGNTIIVPPQPSTLAVGATDLFTYPLYTTPGLKTLTVTATAGSCVATQTLSIFVVQVVPQFTFTAPTFTCMPSLITTYSNQTTANAAGTFSYGWSVNSFNGVTNYTSSAVNPTFTLTQGILNPYAYYGMYIASGQLGVHLINPAILGGACEASIFHATDSLWRPTPWFTTNVKEGCAPLVVKLVDSSWVAHLNGNPWSKYPVTSYTWNNGANPATIITGTVPPAVFNPTFTYSSPGTYTPFITIQTAGGCGGTSFIDTIIVVDPPTVSLTLIPKQSVCVGEPVQLHMTASPTSSLIQHWHIESDAGFFSGCVTDSMPTWPFTHPGVHGFTISAYEHSCKGESASTQTILVKGPLAGLNFTTNCTNPKSVDFGIYLEQAQTATLSFGDGNFTTLAGNPTGIASSFSTHIYGANQDYTAAITAENPSTGCLPYTHTVLVQIRNINASFVFTNSVVCRGAPVELNASASTGVYTTCTRGYTWIFDSAPIVQNFTTTLSDVDATTTSGTHTVTLWVKDVNNCTSALTKTYVVASPAASFSFALPTCLSNMPLQLVNTTTMSPVPAYSFTWNFGAGPNSFSVTNSNTVWPVYNYTATSPSQIYEITLVAVGIYTTCPDTMKQTVEIINPPSAFLYPYKGNPCLNTPVYFNVPPAITNSVNFGDGSPISVSTASTISHTYTSSGVYYPTLGLGYGGCVNTITSQVNVQDYPVTNFTFSPGGNTFCAPVTLTLVSTSVSGTTALGYSWYVGSSGPTISSSIVAQSYLSSGIYTITLGSFPLVNAATKDCMTSISKTITIEDPKAAGVLDKTSFCLGETIKLHLKDTTDILSWVWYFGNGERTDTIYANSSPSPTFSYPYQFFPSLTGGATTVNLVYFPSGYTCNRGFPIAIQVNKVDAAFDRNLEQSVIDSVHCLNIPDKFGNESKFNNGTFIATLGFTWDFGDGNNSTALSPNHTYQNAGVYTVSLIAIDGSLGCKNTSVKHMTINPIPDVSIAVPDSICSGSPFVLTSITSTDVSQYQWHPVFGVASPNSATTAVTASVSTTYSLDVTSIYGCKNSSKPEFVYIQQPSPSVSWDTTIIVGQVITIHAYPGTNYTYTWSPPGNLNCTNCLNVTSTTTANITYSVVVEDNMMCFKVTSTYAINVDPQSTVDVPTAFTPNGDGVNDIIYVDGWGIKKLDYFRIFNRWGQLLFESNDIKVGWDGTYNGVPQNMETYVYQVSAETYQAGKSLQKSSTFRLIR